LDVLNFYIIAILTIKIFDMFFKIELIRQRYIRKDMDKELEGMLGMKLTPWMGLFGALMYVPLLFMGIFP
jgi:hypothetical protein